MKKKIKLNIQDERKSFGYLHQSKPYFLFLEYGEKRFYFSNKQIAKKWLVQFEIKLTDLLKELVSHFVNLIQLNISLTEYFEPNELSTKRDIINHLLARYGNLYLTSDVAIGREINNIYFEILDQYKFYIFFLRNNNRFNYQYELQRQNLKSLKRLKVDLELLTTKVDNCIITEKKQKKVKNLSSFLKIV